MPLCHQCPWNDRPPTEAKRAACLACPGPGEPSHKGRTHLSIESGGPQTASEVEASLLALRGDDDDAQPLDESDPTVQAAMMAGGMRLLLYIKSLKKEQLVLLWIVLNEGSLAKAGRKLHRTRAMISHLWRGLVRERPELADVLAGGGAAPPRADETPQGRQAGGGDGGYVQLELF